MTLALVAKLVHILLGIGLVAELIGRTLVLRRARAAEDVRIVSELAGLAGTFDRRLVVPCSQLVVLFGLATAWLQGWPILGFLVGGSSNWVLASLVLFAGIIALVATVFLPSGRAFEAALEEAVVAGAVSPRLHEAFDDRRVRWARQYEGVAILAILVLMVLKPF